MGWAWGGVLIGVVIVALAVGIPYFMTHRRMREHRDVSDSRYYLRAAEVAVAAPGPKREPALVSPGDSKVVIPPLPLWRTRVAAPARVSATTGVVRRIGCRASAGATRPRLLR
jgi:hypothetical protein